MVFYPKGVVSFMNECAVCNHLAITLHYQNGNWVCRQHYLAPDDSDTCRLFEYGHENPIDAKGSTAHVRDIKARRIDPKTKTFFYYEKPKTYFFPK